MKKILFLGILLLGFELAGQAQTKTIRFVNTLPSGCITNIAPPVIYQGKLYQCTSGTYQLPSGGGIGTGDSPTLTGQWTFASGAITTSKPITITQTWNGAGVTFNPFLVNVTDTASASASLLADFQVASTSKFKISKLGATTQASIVATSQTVGVPAAQFQAASGEASSATVLSVKDGAGTQIVNVTAAGRIDLPAGTVAAPSLTLGTAGSGLYAAAGGLVSIAGSGSELFRAGFGTVYMPAGTVNYNTGTVVSFHPSGTDTIQRRAAANNLALGAADVNGTPVSQRFSVQNAITGSNLPGVDRHIDCARGTGSGNFVDIDFNVALPGAGATTQNTLVNALKIKGSTGDLYMPNSGSAVGVILKSPDATCYRITVANGGTLTTTSITCP